MYQLDTKKALMQCTEISKAYALLKKMVQEDKYWFIDTLEYFDDTMPVIFHLDCKVRFSENCWLVFCELENDNRYGFAIVELEEDDEDYIEEDDEEDDE